MEVLGWQVQILARVGASWVDSEGLTWDSDVAYKIRRAVKHMDLTADQRAIVDHILSQFQTDL